MPLTVSTIRTLVILVQLSCHLSSIYCHHEVKLYITSFYLLSHLHCCIFPFLILTRNLGPWLDVLLTRLSGFKQHCYLFVFCEHVICKDLQKCTKKKSYGKLLTVITVKQQVMMLLQGWSVWPGRTRRNQESGDDCSTNWANAAKIMLNKTNKKHHYIKSKKGEHLNMTCSLTD